MAVVLSSLCDSGELSLLNGDNNLVGINLPRLWLLFFRNVNTYRVRSWSDDNNKTFNKRKNRALLTFRRLQKHYEIFSNNVLRKNITQKQFRVNLVPRVSHLTAPLALPRGR